MLDKTRYQNLIETIVNGGSNSAEEDLQLRKELSSKFVAHDYASPIERLLVSAFALYGHSSNQKFKRYFSNALRLWHIDPQHLEEETKAD